MYNLFDFMKYLVNMIYYWYLKFGIQRTKYMVTIPYWFNINLHRSAKQKAQVIIQEEKQHKAHILVFYG